VIKCILRFLGLYSIYLFYVGISVLKHTTEDKQVVYTLVCAGVIILVTLVVETIISRVAFQFTGIPYLY